MGKPRKVAYVVFKGYQPGVYNTWQQANQQVNGFPNNEYKGYTEKDGGRIKAEEDYIHYAESNPIPGAQLRTPLIGKNAKKKERPPSWQTETNVRSKLRCTDHNSVLMEGSALQNVQQNHPNHYNLRKRQTSLVSRELVEADNWDGSDSPGSQLDSVMGQGIDTNIADGHDYRADITALPDNEWKGRLIGEGNYRLIHSNIQYPVIDMPSKDVGTAHVEDRFFQDRNSGEDHIALCSDSESCTDYGDFPSDIGTLDQPATAHDTEPQLCGEQLELVNIILNGRNVFYTGSAGCGKSTVLRFFVARLNDRGSRVRIIAPTGKAALEVGGATLYNYAGWTLDILGRPMKELEQNTHQRRTWKRIKDTDVLIIDEISMVENHIFERLNRVMKSARGDKRPFGGVQIIVTGDFCQLPPVMPFRFCMECGTKLLRHSGGRLYECEVHGEIDGSEQWAFCSDAWKDCDFVHFRLKSVHRQKELVFKTLLEKCRLGRSLDQEEKSLLLEHECETTGAVKLFPTRNEIRAYPAAEGNMLVILLVNLGVGAGLVNGSQGVIVGFETHNEFCLPEQYGKYSARKQGLIKEFIKRAAVREWPIVQFQNGVKRTIYAHCMMSELGDKEPYNLLSRTQIPLVAAWAMTIHKSQGMTLSRVIVDLSKEFETGQGYVALSRARSLHGLKVEALGERSWGCNKEVLKFMGQHGWLDE